MTPIPLVSMFISPCQTNNKDSNFLPHSTLLLLTWYSSSSRFALPRYMDREKSNRPCYYSVLGIRNNASVSEIRSAYRKLALKWHPDRWTRDPTVVGEAKRRFQQIQEAYSVLSDEGKRAMYDVGLYDPFEEEDEGFSDFMQEMLSMMDNVGAEKDSFEDLQKMFVEMIQGEDGDKSRRPTVSGSQGNAPKRGAYRVNVSSFMR